VDEFAFPDCMHRLSAALHREMIDPSRIQINMPRDDWWKLYQALDRKFRGMMPFDGRGNEPTQFKYMGFTFVIQQET
jgi:hypothetical protein